jgi:peptidylprolyl isomerase
MLQASKQAKPGDRVRVHFNGTLKDGTLFDTTYEGSGGCESDDCDCGDDNCNCSEDGCGCGDPAGPMELEVGAENFFPQVEEALIGMAVGDRKTITIKTEDAFGEYDAEQVSAVPRDQFPDDIDPQIGDSFELVNDDGDGMVVMVIEVDDKEITLDANHPLAGEDLTLELEMIEIK